MPLPPAPRKPFSFGTAYPRVLPLSEFFDQLHVLCRLGGVVAEERVNRRLAAILCADVAQYSRLMGSDEEGTLAALMAHRRELVDPLIAQHQGRIVKTTGDGLLIEFASVVDAVRCAVVVQSGMDDRNA